MGLRCLLKALRVGRRRAAAQLAARGCERPRARRRRREHGRDRDGRAGGNDDGDDGAGRAMYAVLVHPEPGAQAPRQRASRARHAR